MFWLILMGVTVIATIYWMIADDFGWFLGSLMTACVLILSIIFVALGAGMSCAIADECAARTPVLIESKPLIALKDNSDIVGTKYLFSGTIKEAQYYYYIEETEFGYKQNKIQASSAYIKYDNESPRIETYVNKYKNLIVRFFCGNTSINETVVIYIPEGSIVENYEIDLE